MTRAIAAAALLLSGAASAQSLNAQGIARLNQDIASLWTHDGVPMAQSAAAAEGQKLLGDHVVDSKTTVSVLAINALTLGISASPGVQQLDANGARLSLPLGSSWNATVDARVRVRTRILFNIDQTFNVKAEITGLNADISTVFDSSDPAAPKETKVNPPGVRFNVKITSSNLLVSAVGFLGSALVDGLVGKALIAIAAKVVAQRLAGMTANTPSLMNAGGPALAAVARADLEGAAAKLGDQMEKLRTPFGPTLEMRFDQPYTGTWAQSLNDPSFNPGNGIAPHAY